MELPADFRVLPGNGVALDRDIRSARPTVVAYGGLHQEIGMPPFEFFNLLSSWPVNRIFVRDVAQTFYQNGVPALGDTLEHMANSLSEYIPCLEQTLFVGTSGGGYAALALGAVLGVRVLAVAPITVLELLPRVVHADHRWQGPMWRALRASRRHKEQRDLRRFLMGRPVSAQVWYPDGNRLDRFHAFRIGNLSGVDLRKINSNRHDVIREMRDDGTLVRLIAAALRLDGI